jgi:hypothetical protein
VQAGCRLIWFDKAKAYPDIGSWISYFNTTTTITNSGNWTFHFVLSTTEHPPSSSRWKSYQIIRLIKYKDSCFYLSISRPPLFIWTSWKTSSTRHSDSSAWILPMLIKYLVIDARALLYTAPLLFSDYVTSTLLVWWRYHHSIVETRTLALTLHLTSNLRVSSLGCVLSTQSTGVWVLPCSGVQALVLRLFVRAGVSSRVAEYSVPSQFAVSFN